MIGRKALREVVAMMLQTTLTPAYPVEADQPTTLDGRSPIVVVASAGTDRAQAQPRRMTFGGPGVPDFYLDIYGFVLATADADDLLDDFEAGVARFVSLSQTGSNEAGTLWTAISYDGRSQTKFLDVLDGKQYKFEVIPLKFTGAS